MTTNQGAVAVEATVTQAAWQDGFGAVMGLVTGCFPRRETRQTMREMTEALLMGLQRVNCWTLAEALGHSGPHRLQHFLARAVWDHKAVREQLARWVVDHLADGQAVLVVDETGDEKSSTDAVGNTRTRITGQIAPAEKYANSAKAQALKVDQAQTAAARIAAALGALPLPPHRVQSATYVRDVPSVKSAGLFGSLRHRREAQLFANSVQRLACCRPTPA
ncbi:transposase [Streptomyces sp. NPDC099050]|uniref:transposase n=1 Tax=Streptomyces sp. NPDC099050 TaxID=3366100 RepID=UPI0038280F2F